MVREVGLKATVNLPVLLLRVAGIDLRVYDAVLNIKLEVADILNNLNHIWSEHIGAVDELQHVTIGTVCVAEHRRHPVSEIPERSVYLRIVYLSQVLCSKKLGA